MNVGDKVKVIRARLPLNLGKTGEVIDILNDPDEPNIFVRLDQPMLVSSIKGGTAWTYSSYAYFTKDAVVKIGGKAR